MKPVYVILPNENKERVKQITRWLGALPELKLLAPVRCVELEWKNGVTGEPEDWMKVVAVIQAHWQEAEGFVVWAPQASLLEAAGTAALMFQESGKPIVFFAADYPDVASNNPADHVGIKSRLINAVYIACADLGEVGVLIDHELHRPSSCEWGREKTRLAPVSSRAPLATIGFQLHLQGDYARRTNQLKVKEPAAFEKALSFISWYPGADSVFRGKKSEGVVIAAESVFWPHQDVQYLRQEIQAGGVPLIWYSHQDWPAIDWNKNEIGVAHDHAWWAALVAQFAFGDREAKKDPDKRLDIVQTLIRI